MLVENTSLILEGGGMRGFYTSGILDYFIERGLQFKNVLGVSSGAIMGLFYVSGQKMSDFTESLSHADLHEAIGVKNFLNRKGLINSQYIYHELIPNIVGFDYDGFMNSPMKFIIGAMQRETGEMVYFDDFAGMSEEDILKRVEASSALPIIMPAVKLDGNTYVDGGIIDSIAYKEMEARGIHRHTMILTQPRGYVKHKQRLGVIVSLWLNRFPKLKRALSTRHIRYNDALKGTHDLEKQDRAFVFHPTDTYAKRLETSGDNLIKMYRQGYDLAKENFDDLMKFIEEAE